MATPDVHIVNLTREIRFRQDQKRKERLLENLGGTRVPCGSDVSGGLAFSSCRPIMKVRVSGQLSYSVGLLHLMTHGSPDDSGKVSRRTWRGTWKHHYLHDHRALLDYLGLHARADGVLFDACYSFNAGRLAALASLLPRGRQFVVIGTTDEVGVKDAGNYTELFYEELFGSGAVPRRADARRHAYLRAHRAAHQRFGKRHGKDSLFRAKVLVGTR